MFYKTVSIFLLFLSFTIPSFAANEQSLTVVYTADVLGEDKPKHLWGGKTAGGLARKSTMIASLRFDDPDLLLLDCGGVIPFRGVHRRMKADLIFKAMNKMSYNAMNLSGSDFSFGLQYLETLSESLSFPFLSSNLVSSRNSKLPPWIKPYTITVSKGLRVGILGIMPENSFDEIPENKKPSEFQIIPPAEALDHVLPDLSQKSDFIVLLSQLDFESTASLVGQFSEIDLAISHEKRGGMPVPQKEGATFLTPCGTKSSNIEIIELSIGPGGKSTIVQNKPISLLDGVPHDEDIDNLINNSYLEEIRKIRDARFAEKSQAFHKNLMNGLQISPEDFLKQMQQDNKETPSSTVNSSTPDKEASESQSN